MLQGASALGVSHVEQELGLKPRTFAAMPAAEAAAGKKGLYPQVDQIMNDYAKSRSFWITGIIKEDILKQARNFVFQYAKEHPGWEVMPDGEKVGFEEGLYKTLREFLPTRDKAGNMINVAARSEVVARTNMMDVYNLARYQVMNSPGLKGWVQAYRYTAIIDSATTTICRHLHGKIFTDETLNGYVPPNHYNCRSMLLPVTRLDQNWEAEMRQQGPVDVKPAAGFATPAGTGPAVPTGKVAIPGETLPGEIPPKVPKPKAPPKPEMVDVKLEDLLPGVGGLPMEVGLELERELLRIGKKIPKEQVQAVKEALQNKKVEIIERRKNEMVPWDLGKRAWLQAYPQEVQAQILSEFPKGEFPRQRIEGIEQDAKRRAGERKAQWEAANRAKIAEIARREAARVAQEAEAARIAAVQRAEAERIAVIERERLAREAERVPVGRFKAQNEIENWKDLPAGVRKKAADWAWRQGELQAGAVGNVKARLQGMIEKWMRQEGAAPAPVRPDRAPVQVPAAGAFKIDIEQIRFERKRGGRWDEHQIGKWREGIANKIREAYRIGYPGGIIVQAGELEAFKVRFAREVERIVMDVAHIERPIRNVNLGRLEPMDTAARVRAAEANRIALEEVRRQDAIRAQQARERAQLEAQRAAQRAVAERAEREEAARIDALKIPSFKKAQVGSPPETMKVKSGHRLTAGSGINATYRIKLDDGTKWAFKPVKGEDFHGVRSSITNENFTLGHREVLAFRLDQLIGTKLVPEVYFREVTLNGKNLGWGSMMKWNDNSTVAHRWSGAEMTQEFKYKFAVLDMVIANTDRHGANYMFKNSTSKPSAIDHGYTFPQGSPHDPGGISQNRWDASSGLKVGDPMGEAWRKEVARNIRNVDLASIREAFPTMSKLEYDALVYRLEKVATALENNTIRGLSRGSWS